MVQVFVPIFFGLFCEFFSRERGNCVNERSELARICSKETLIDFKKSYRSEEKMRLRKNFFEDDFGSKLPDLVENGLKNSGF